MSAPCFAALSGFLGVVLGAFGAHALKHTLVAHDMMTVWQTAVLYHLIHAVAAFAIAEKRPAVTWMWCLGILLFSGSLYLLALTCQRWFGLVTPFGGLCFLIGWAMCLRNLK